MNYDVEDPEQGLQPDLERKDHALKRSNRQQPHSFLSHLRGLNISSFGSVFSGPLSAVSSYVTRETIPKHNNYGTWDYAYDLEAGNMYDDLEFHRYQDFCNNTESYTTKPSNSSQPRFNSPLQSRSGPLSEVKRLFRTLTRPRHADLHRTSSCNDWNDLGTDSRQNHPPLYAPSVYDWDVANGSPLTTDSDISTIPSPTVAGKYDNSIKLNCDDEEHALEWAANHSYSSEIREGKKPDRGFQSYEFQDERPGDCDSKNEPLTREALGVYNDQDEWYGLEYTMELSCRERHPSDGTKSAGEHSKSRESWAAIHQGTVHPYFEDEDYYEWKNWHRFLDRLDEHKKHKRGLEFKARSKDLAWQYVEEMHARDLLYWQKATRAILTHILMCSTDVHL
ncbi:hypothetical protein H0H92_011752 [Tricholoma furcatifolium]|nr:hypothetical protein H0H92_011752 [Tricholoma furcatifolium]